ncbi:ser-Thr-rich glycosyl-phosphatidyl-inositol-anchored membrane family protein [bacterium BMS3Abin03]|nr:ser-Thr-rich glycosyl-phosphatidyl-inositol-anchored membrane family protein [bacterium BMS3Abin03]
MRLHSSLSIMILTSVFFLSTGILFAQNSSEFLWNNVQEESIITNGERFIIPESYRTLQLDFNGMGTFLRSAPEENIIPVSQSSFIISLPMPNGEFSKFKMVESPVMAEELAAKYPNIKTFLGQGTDDGTASVRFDVTPLGFHAMILSARGTVFIDPYSLGDTEYYISYYTRDNKPTEEELNFTCNLYGTDSEAAQQLRDLIANGYDTPTGPELRTYRLACAATGEYTMFFGGTVELGLAAVVVAVNRVTGVYERDFAVRMELVPNNDLLIYTDPSTDPYSNYNGFTMLGQNQTNVDAVIGSANYDIGHVFSTGGGGVAYLAVICINNYKARGVTGLSNPVGDNFYIDYVAHEMGHQFGGNHSFNGNANACGGGNRNGSTAYEPGSGSTIMAYAGICGNQNLQAHSDDYFHNISFVEIVNYTNFGNGNSCAAITLTGNNPPTVDAGTGGYVLPVETPFILTGSATDPDGDTLTYNWEEYDLGPAGHPNNPSGNAPIFRSFQATLEPYRIFPKLGDLLTNTHTIGELLPTYARTLKFRLTVRDNRAGGGGVDYDEITMTVTDVAGPFLVTSPNTAVTWQGNTMQSVTWSVANTDAAPVNVTEVNLLLSTDGGYTWPIVLVSNTPNDGTEQVSVPNEVTSQARIKVEAVGNIFFDLSDEDFTIEDNPVPVELTAFFAVTTREGPRLIWTTSTELNNAGFDIERARFKTGGQQIWEKIYFVAGHGTTTQPQEYIYIDKNVNPGRYSYRLKQVDYDGSYSYSGIVDVDVNVPEVFILSQNYPNPFNPSTTIKFSLPVDSKVKINLYNALGEVMELLANGEYSVGYHELNFDASSLTSGVYYYTLTAQGNDGSSFVSTKKMVLLK